jgi:hypothetical protein
MKSDLPVSRFIGASGWPGSSDDCNKRVGMTFSGERATAEAIASHFLTDLSLGVVCDLFALVPQATEKAVQLPLISKRRAHWPRWIADKKGRIQAECSTPDPMASAATDVVLLEVSAKAYEQRTSRTSYRYIPAASAGRSGRRAPR